MSTRSQRHLREQYGADSAGEADPGVTAVRSPTSITAAATTETTLTVTLTAYDGVTLVQGAKVSCVSGTPAAATVSPASSWTNSLGVATFTVTNVATGSSTLTFSSSTDATIASVSVTTS